MLLQFFYTVKPTSRSRHRHILKLGSAQLGSARLSFSVACDPFVYVRLRSSPFIRLVESGCDYRKRKETRRPSWILGNNVGFCFGVGRWKKWVGPTGRKRDVVILGSSGDKIYATVRCHMRLALWMWSLN